MNSSRLSRPGDLRGRSIFLTGGTGFVGRCLLDYFLESAQAHGPEFKVVVLSRSPQSFLARYPRYADLAWLEFKVGSLDHLPQLEIFKFTDVLHAAADTHVDSSPLGWLDQLVQGTRNVLDFAVASGAERFLLVSSGAVYGTTPDGVVHFKEDAPFAPLTTDTKSVYGQGKRLAEHLCAIYGQQFGLTCVIARCFALISEHMPLDGPYAAGNFMRDALAGKHIEILGDGSSVRSYLHGRDAAHWLVSLMTQGGPGQIYNVGSDVPVSILELARAIAMHATPPLEVRVLNQSAPGPRAIYLPNVEKASKLGLRIETSLFDAIASTIGALSHPTASPTA
ncbi:NAD-dependent epimerase/dehydratase family protein [Herbaspirillum seropedicae]|uniref:NAD-dependent epimerase/dehydratase family protein n=1 Tax=Herbaspirillum seropedicae TaxID=964 RepID=UPI003D95A067